MRRDEGLAGHPWYHPDSPSVHRRVLRVGEPMAFMCVQSGVWTTPGVLTSRRHARRRPCLPNVRYTRKLVFFRQPFVSAFSRRLASQALTVSPWVAVAHSLAVLLSLITGHIFCCVLDYTHHDYVLSRAPNSCGVARLVGSGGAAACALVGAWSQG